MFRDVLIWNCLLAVPILNDVISSSFYYSINYSPRLIKPLWADMVGKKCKEYLVVYVYACMRACLCHNVIIVNEGHCYTSSDVHFQYSAEICLVKGKYYFALEIRSGLVIVRAFGYRNFAWINSIWSMEKWAW